MTAHPSGNISLSAFQRRFWFLSQLNEHYRRYQHSRMITLRGHLDEAKLQQSLQNMRSVYEEIGASFIEVDGEPRQQIHEDTEISLITYKMEDLSPSEQSRQLDALMSAMLTQPFNLSIAPLMWTVLVRFSAEHHVLLVSASPMIFNEHTLVRFMNEVLEDYALDTYRPDKKSRQDYWLTQISDAAQVLELPVDYPRPAVQSLEGIVITETIFPALHRDLDATAQALNTDIATLLLTAFYVLLYRYTGQEDFLAGVLAGDGENADILPLFIPMKSDIIFADLVNSVTSTLNSGIQHQLSFSEIIDLLNLPFDPGRAPLVQAEFAFEDDRNLRELLNESDHIDVTSMSLQQRSTSADLRLRVRYSQETFFLDFIYAKELYNIDSIARMTEHYFFLLMGICENPQSEVIRLPLISDAERETVLLDWNQTEVAYPDTLCFHEIFQLQTAKAPHRVAAVYDGESLSYYELNRRANRLAHYLKQQGIKSEQVVAIFSERNLDYLTAFIAILKAGAAYLPIDPRYPAPRIQHVAKQSETQFILTTRELAPRLDEAFTDAKKRPDAIIMRDVLENSRLSDDNPNVSVSVEDMAYIIFTSGSTGLPKGAMVEHRGMVNHLYAKVYDLELTEDDAVAQNAPQSFDISVWQMLVALVCGARVHIYDALTASTPHVLLREVARDQISILEVVPSIMRIMVEAVQEARAEGSDFKLPHLRWLMPTGEALPPTLARQWLEYYPRVPLINAYGPTECSDDVTHYPVYEPPPQHVVNMSIGRPVANMRMYILDEIMQPVPVGVRGELYVAGIGVGRGYIHDPVKTAKAFMNDPFSDNPEARFYRTGDVAKYLPDGNIEYLGRVDFQVKVNGVRVELQEIEVALEKSPKVRECVVTLYQRTPTSKHLAAYVVPAQPDMELSSRDLSEYLRDHIPATVIPSAYVFMDALPLTPNGKINRKALPAPNAPDTGETYTAPRNPVEEQLAKLWADVLETEKISIHDNFFELGGHSLLAARLIARIEKEMGENVSLDVLFQLPTVAELADVMQGYLEIDRSSAVIPIQKGDPQRTPFFWTHSSDFFNMRPYMSDKLPFYAIRPAGMLEDESILDNVHDIVQYHIDAIQAVQPKGPYLIGGYCNGGLNAFAIAQRLMEMGEEIQMLVLIDVEPPDGQYAQKATPGLAGRVIRVAREGRLLSAVRKRLVERTEELTTEIAGNEQSRLLQQIVAAHDATFEPYAAPVPYTGPLTLIECEDLYTRRGEISQARWSKIAPRGFEMHVNSGDHDSMIRPPHVEELGNRIREILETQYTKM